MTLEEVASTAAISKGGLLHHFAGKKELVLGIVHRQLTEFDHDIERRRLADPIVPGSFTRAFLTANLEPDEHSNRICLALLMESRTIPEVLDAGREYSQRWEQRLLNDGLDPEIASIVRYAGDGLVFASLWGLPRPANYEAIVERLLALTKVPTP